MTETVRQPCIRGCTKAVLDTETREKIGTEPRLATVGFLDSRCADNLHGWLIELPDLVSMLDPRLERGDIFSPARRGKISGSPALVRLDVEAMTDPRSVAYDRLDPEAKSKPEIRFGGDVPGILESWASNLCDDLTLTGRPKGLVASVELLTGPWWSNVCYRPWIDELYAEIHEIRGVLRQLNNVHDPMPVGDCNCGQKLFLPEDGSAAIKCRHCGHRLDGLAIVRLKAAQTITEASA